MTFVCQILNMKKVFLVACITLSVSGFAQKVSNKLSFQKGQKLEVTTEMNRSSTQELMGQSMESTMKTSNTNVYEVSDATPANALVNVSVKKVKLDMSLMGRNESFDSDKPDDVKSDIGKMMGSALNQKYTMTVDAAGSVTAVKEDENKQKNKSGDESAGLGMFLGTMGTGTSMPKVGDATLFKILPDKEVGKGDTWKTESADESGKKTTTYTITDITDNDILIDFTEDGTLNTKQQIMGQDAAFEVKSKSSGKIVLDRKTGLLKQKTFDTTSDESMSAGGMSIPSKGKTTTTITVKAL